MGFTVLDGGLFCDSQYDNRSLNLLYKLLYGYWEIKLF